ncbi:MAG: sulfite exporter TauE/SafE family protein, partial [Chitinophagaceae bacterium]|nr:sulfite exporter TauE/SafE family protein [Chitinophagaceae bacterium]
LALSIFMLLLSIYLLSGHHKTLQRTQTNMIGGGVISGFMAGLLGTGGAIRGIILVVFALPKHVFVATSAWIDMGVDSGRLMVYLYNGYLKKEVLWMIPVLILISVIGSWLGKQVINKLPEEMFQRIVLTLILCVAIIRLVDYFGEVF